MSFLLLLANRGGVITPHGDENALGGYRLGDGALGSDTTHDDPTVTVTAPTGTITSGGPFLTVSWDYAQPQDDPQEAYRLIVETPVRTHDTGWVLSSADTVALDLRTLALMGDDGDFEVAVTVQVMSDRGATAEGDTSATVNWGSVGVEVNTPSSVVVTEHVTTTWTFTDSEGADQAEWRVRLRTEASGLLIHDSGWRAGDDATYDVPTGLTDGSRYTLTVEVRNPNGVQAADTLAFQVDLVTAAPVEPEPAVGRVYEVGLNGRGYMLFDNWENEEFRYERLTVPLDPPRLATSETPFSEAVERYSFAAMTDWEGGAGQYALTRESSVGNAFWDSRGVDPFTFKGRLRLLPDVELEQAVAENGLLSVIVGDELFYTYVGATSVWRITDPGASPSEIPLEAGDSVLDLTTDGRSWYVAVENAGDPAGVVKGTTSTPSGRWSSVPLERLGWAAGRIVGSYASGTSTTPQTFTSLAEDGTEEVVSGHLVLDDDWSVGPFTAGSGKAWFGASVTGRGLVYVWDLDSTPSVALELPVGEVPTALFHYLGQVFLRCEVRTSPTVAAARIYRCVPAEDGTLTPFLVTTLESEDVDQGPGVFQAVAADLVVFSWAAPFGADGDVPGLGCIDLASGGWCRWLEAPEGTGTAPVGSVSLWRSRTVFTVDGAGVFVQGSGFVPAGWARTSVFDGGSAVDKVWDQVALEALPLDVGESVQLAYSTDNLGSYTAIPEVLAGAGTSRARIPVEVSATSLGLEVRLGGPGTSTPELTLLQVRFHPLGLADTVLILPVDCGDEVRGLNGAPLPENGPGAGAIRARELQALTQTRVTVQDVDWHLTGRTELYEVVQVQVRKVSLYDRNQGMNGLRMVAVVTLRRRER